jgi:cupin 2 domain-containing protein
MPPKVSNLFDPRPEGEVGEKIIPLIQRDALQLESIVSHGQPTEENFWYDQPRAEWVLLTQGKATLGFDGGGIVELKAGDYLLIPAHAKHRVESCSEDARWLALHFG